MTIHRMFQSTPPERGATSKEWFYRHSVQVSIHAPREGSDQARKIKDKILAGFNPRPPRGERLTSISLAASISMFQSTPPERGATIILPLFNICAIVSIHAPREGSDTPI